MMAVLTQILAMFGRRSEHAPKRVPNPSPYRARCGACDDLNRDARLPCQGHAQKDAVYPSINAVDTGLLGKIVSAPTQSPRGQHD